MDSAICIFILATLAVFANAETDWCNIKTCKDHTCCKYPFLKVDEKKCGEVKSSSLTDSEKKEMLDLHNKWRAYVASGQEKRGNPGPQPAATNLHDVAWDDELASVAQTWADQCAYGHDGCRDVDRFKVGQNIAYSASTAGYDDSWVKVMTQWYDEVEVFKGSNAAAVPADEFKDAGHYTQAMWAESTLVGCGGIRYKPDGGMYTMYVVCNYGPAGNMVGEPLYKTK